MTLAPSARMNAMETIPVETKIHDFLAQKSIAVAGVSAIRANTPSAI